MDAADWKRTLSLVERALERPEGQREGFLREACADEPELLERALVLLRNDSRADGILTESGREVPGSPRAGRGPRAGTALGAWVLERELGSGGMGTVWLASRREASFEQRVAVKLLKGGLASHEIGRRFRREQRLLASLDHPGIARMIDAGDDEACGPYLVMELVDGRPIDAWCRERALELRARVELFVKVLGAVEHAHRRLVVHRDLKPSNVLVSSEGEPKLLDFGIAKLLGGDGSEDPDLTLTGQRLFTPRYASPEQVEGRTIGVASDVYSLGVMLYELLTGTRPYDLASLSATESARVVVEEDPPPPSQVARATVGADTQERSTRWRRALEGDLDAIVMNALRKEPDRRYGSIEAFAADLEGLPVRARPDTVGYRTRKFLRRHGVSVTAAAALVLSLVGGLAGIGYQFIQAEDAREAEERQKTLALQRADELEALAAELRQETARAERRAADVRRFATTLVFDAVDAVRGLPGSVPVRALLIESGLASLDALAAEAEDDHELELELAGAYIELGKVMSPGEDENTGQALAALPLLEKAHALAIELDPEGRQTHRGLSVLAEATTRLVTCLSYLGRTREATEIALAALERVRPRARSEAATDADLLAAAVLLDRVAARDTTTGRLERAARLSAECAELTGRLLQRHPGQPPALNTHARALSRQAGVARMAYDLEAAEELLEEALEVMERIDARSRQNVTIARNLSTLRMDLGELLSMTERREESLWLVEEGFEEFEAIAETASGDRGALEALTGGLNSLGRVRLRNDEPEAALEAFERALILVEGDGLDERGELLRGLDASMCLFGMGQALAASGDGERALDRLDEALARADRFVSRIDSLEDHDHRLLHLHADGAEAALLVAERAPQASGLARRAIELGTRFHDRGLLIADEIARSGRRIGHDEAMVRRLDACGEALVRSGARPPPLAGE